MRRMIVYAQDDKYMRRLISLCAAAVLLINERHIHRYLELARTVYIRCVYDILRKDIA
jgi:hypothetical protein